MKLTLFEISKWVMFLQFFENLLNVINVDLMKVLGIDKDIIKINNDKNIELLGQNFINIILETD